jgi:hypothetical protein
MVAAITVREIITIEVVLPFPIVSVQMVRYRWGLDVGHSFFNAAFQRAQIQL